MKTKMIGFVLLFVFFMAALPSVNAKISTSYRHMSDDYAVTFFERNGDALVSAKLQIKNVQSNESINYLILEIPGDIVVYDVGELIEDYIRISDDASRSISSVYDARGRISSSAYGYIETIYKYEKIREDSITEQKSGDLTILTIVLPEEIKVDKEATILLTYKLKGYAKKGLLGAYEFDFKTINDINSDLIVNTRVAIDVVPGLYWRGKGAEVKYSPPPNIKYVIPEIKKSNETNQSFKNKSVEGKIELNESVIVAPFSSTSYSSASYMPYEDKMPTMQKLQMEVVYNKDKALPISSAFGGMGSYSTAISNAGGYVKTTSYLDNREVSHVKGIYSDSKYRLYLGRIILGIIISLIFLLILIKVLPKVFYAVKTRIKGLHPEKTSKEKAVKIKKELGFRKIALISFLSAMSMAILFFIIAGIYNWAHKTGLSSSNNLVSILFFVIVIMIIVLETAIFIGVPLYCGIKQGIREGIIILLNTILWILVLLLIAMPFMQWIKW